MTRAACIVHEAHNRPCCWLPRSPGLLSQHYTLTRETLCFSVWQNFTQALPAFQYSNGTRQQRFPLICFITQRTYVVFLWRWVLQGLESPLRSYPKKQKQVVVTDFQLFFSFVIHFYNLNSLFSAPPQNIKNFLRASWKQEISGKMHSHWHSTFLDHENLHSQMMHSSTELEHKL